MRYEDAQHPLPYLCQTYGHRRDQAGLRWAAQHSMGLSKHACVAQKLEPAGKHDACYLPRRIHVTGDIDIHELAYDRNHELWLVNTRFCCFVPSTPSIAFVPRWRPPFVSALAPEDRCHLNGLCMVDGRPKYVTALAETDTAGAWRAHKARGGLLLD